MMFNQTDALKVAKRTNVGGIAHIGEHCIVKYGRDNYHVYKAGYLFSSQGHVTNGTLQTCVDRVFTIESADTLRVIVDNN